MSDNSTIEWTDATWNPTTGCDKVSPGCDHCYAMTLAKRLKGMGSAHYQTDGNPATSGPGFGIAMHPDALDKPLHWAKPKRIFVNSMSDLFHDGVTDEFIARVFAVMALAPQHTFQVLTKRHGRMRSLLNSDRFDELFADALYTTEHPRGEEPAEPVGSAPGPLPNVWLGVSVENQKWADIRIPALLDTPAAVRFLSCEPLLGPVDMRWRVGLPRYDAPRIHWVIAGGESGPGARPMHPDWARSLRDQCTAAGIPFHFKQWGSGSRCIDKQGDVWTFGDDGLMHSFETQPFPREHVEKKWGPLKALDKKHAGRELDGRTWDAFPETVTR